MIKDLRWRMVIIVAVVAAAIWKLYPPSKTITLGLDLQGGMHLVLSVETDKAIEFETDRIRGDIKDMLDKKDTPYKSIDVKDGKIELEMPNPDAAYAVIKEIKKQFKEIDCNESVGAKVVGIIDSKDKERIEDLAVRQALEIIRNRVDKFGVAEPSIQRQGKNRLVVQLPGVKDPARARNLIRQTAQLELRLVSDDVDKLKEAMADNPPPGYEVLYMSTYDQSGEHAIPFLVKIKPELTGKNLTAASPTFDSQMNTPQVSFSLDRQGARIFARVTKENIEKKLAIVLDDEIQSAPVIKSEIPNGQGVITGRFSPEEAKDLAVVLTSGALPAPVRIEYEINVGPSLGRDSIRSGIMAALFGIAIVLVFMIIYYYISGLIANFALALNVLLLLGALAAFKATLTLPGIAGIVLTIGMSVDANVLIFERIREEKESGKRIRMAIDNGYKRAFLTIFDSNITTLITSIILYQFGTGPIRGFAVTLSIGILANMFTAIFVTRAIYDLWATYGNIVDLKMRKFFGEPKIDFIGKRYWAYAFSLAVIILGIVVFMLRGEKNYSVDFSGGDLLQLKFENKVEIDEIRKSLAAIGSGDASIQDAGGSKEIMIKARFNEGDKIVEHLQSSLKDADFEVAFAEKIGPTIGKDLKRNALFAVLLSWVGILLYVWIRFDFEFGIGGLIALVHDVLFTLAFLAFTGRELSLSVIAALLTIIGYSINDTIVIYDRIREDLKLMRKDNLPTIINTALNQTLSRTVLTTLTLLFTVVSLYLFGGKVINDFAFAMLIGCISGTYSTVYIASPIVLEWHRRKNMEDVKLSKGSEKKLMQAKR